MPQIIFDITTENAQRILDAFEAIYPIPETVPGTPDYTPGEWARKKLKDYVVDLVSNHEQQIAIQAASDAHQPDPDLVDVT